MAGRTYASYVRRTFTTATMHKLSEDTRLMKVNSKRTSMKAKPAHPTSTNNACAKNGQQNMTEEA